MNFWQEFKKFRLWKKLIKCKRKKNSDSFDTIPEDKLLFLAEYRNSLFYGMNARSTPLSDQDCCSIPATEVLNSTNSEECTTPLVEHVLHPEDILEAVNSDDREQILNAIQCTAIILDSKEKVRIDAVIEVGLIPVFVGILNEFYEDDFDIQYGTLRLLAILTSFTKNTEQFYVILDSGVVPKFVMLMSHSRVQLVELAVWALGLIAESGKDEAANLLLDYGVMDVLIELLQSDRMNDGLCEWQASCLQTSTWTLSKFISLFLEKSPLNFNTVKKAIPFLVCLIHHTNEDILLDTCSSFVWLTRGSKEEIQTAVNCMVILRLVNLLDSVNTDIVCPALKTIANIVAGNSEKIGDVLELDLLWKLNRLLSCEDDEIIETAVGIVSNIVCGSHAQIQDVINAELLPTIIRLFLSKNIKVQQKAATMVINFANHCSPSQVLTFLNTRGIWYYFDLLSSYSVNAETKYSILEGLLNVLEKAQEIGYYEEVVKIIAENNTLDQVLKLRDESFMLFDSARKIVELIP